MSAPEGVTAIVGGSRGTGAELARGILADGGLVLVGYADKETRARQVAGMLTEDKRPYVEIDPPTYGDNARVCKVDVTDPHSVIRFGDHAAAFALEHETTVTTLALMGAIGIGKTVRETFAVNQEGNIATARRFWREARDEADQIALTVFAQSFQGHTAFHPDVDSRVKYPDDYAAVALSKWNGEVGLRLLNRSQNAQQNGRHILAVAVGDALGDSDPIMMLKRRAEQAKDRISKGEAAEGDQKMVDQMEELEGRDDELRKAGFKPVSTASYASMIRGIVDSRPFQPEGVTEITKYIPEKAVIDGRAVDLAADGNPLPWTTLE
jgi:NAD(P)-dependent dehydrogenase (short-subunit alcohol dehydrogenase family)